MNVILFGELKSSPVLGEGNVLSKFQGGNGREGYISREQKNDSKCATEKAPQQFSGLSTLLPEDTSAHAF